jgi:hypothetical protein
MNGTGKSLINKFNWGMSLLANCYCVAKVKGFPFEAVKEMQFIIDTCFDKPDFTGKVETYHENGTIRLDIQGGIVVEVELDIDEDVVPTAPTIYMSGATRKFDDIVQYMKTKRIFGIEGITAMSQEQIIKVCSIYKLYDVMFCEQALLKFNGFVFTDQFKETLAESLKTIPKIKSLKVDYDNCDVLYIDEDGFEHSMTKLSAGEQSYLNMCINCA